MSNRSDIAVALRQLRQRASLTVRALAAAVGLSSSGYAFYEREFKQAALPLSLVEKLMPVLTSRGVDAAAVLALGGLGPGAAGGLFAGEALMLRASDWLLVDVFDMARGVPGLNDPLYEQPIRRSAFAFARRDDLAVVIVGGDAMAPTILGGDTIVADLRARSIGPNGLYLVAWQGDPTLHLRRAERQAGSSAITLTADNPHYKSDLTVDERQVVVLGRILTHEKRIG
jgi:hypothetical protein